MKLINKKHVHNVQIGICKYQAVPYLYISNINAGILNTFKYNMFKRVKLENKYNLVLQRI